MDSRLRGNDINCSFAVIPAKAGIHTAYPDTNAGRRAVAPNVAIDDDGFSPPPTVGPYRSLPGTGVRRQEDGAPDRIRTCDLWLRRPTLYPTELRAPGWCAPARTMPAFAARRAGGNARASSMGQAVRGNPHAIRPGLRVRVGQSVRLDDGTVVDRAAGGQAHFRPTRLVVATLDDFEGTQSAMRTCPGPRPSATIPGFAAQRFRRLT